jgi:hypothetical protein
VEGREGQESRREETNSSQQGLAGRTVGLGLFRTQNRGIDTHTHTHTHTLKDCVEASSERGRQKEHTHKIHTHREARDRGVCVGIKGSAEAGGPTDAAYQ